MSSIVSNFKKTSTQIIVIAFLGLSVYSGTFHAPFAFDDLTSITNNTMIRELNNFAFKPDNYTEDPGRYIGYLSFALNYRFCGLDVTCYHIVNLAIHIINALLIYLLIVLTFRTEILKNSYIAHSSGWIALFTAALFAVHPVETQAVTYIVQRLASLATMFYLFALISYIKARSYFGLKGSSWRRVAGYYLLSIVFALLSMKTKEIAFTLPIVIAFYEFYFFGGRTRTKLLFLLPMLIMLAVIPIGILHSHRSAGDLLSDINAATTASDLPRWDYLLTEFSVVVTYLRLLLLPVGQNLDYDYPISHSLFEPRVLSSLFILLGMLGAALLFLLMSGKGKDTAPRLASFGILWFFITLSVESSFIPIKDVIFEHRAYLPSIGIFMAVACLGAMAARAWPALTKVMTVTAASVVLVLAVAAYERNTVWGSELSLWSDIAKKSPNKVRPHNNLGIAYAINGMTDQEIEQYKIAIGIAPDYPEAHYNLGNAYFLKGMMDMAIEEFKTEIKVDPDHPLVHNDLGNAYVAKGMLDNAIAEYRAALQQNPGNRDAQYNLGFTLLKKGLANDAINELELALKLKPDDPATYNCLGVAYADLKMTDKALEDFQRAASLKPDDTNFQSNVEEAKKQLAVEKATLKTARRRNHRARKRV
jgi:protein O-mannosyl-transferase